MNNQPHTVPLQEIQHFEKCTDLFSCWALNDATRIPSVSVWEKKTFSLILTPSCSHLNSFETRTDSFILSLQALCTPAEVKSNFIQLLTNLFNQINNKRNNYSMPKVFCMLIARKNPQSCSECECCISNISNIWLTNLNFAKTYL